MLNEYTLKNDDILYFLHIPKTAGVSLYHTLSDNFDLQSIYPKYNYYDVLIQNPPPNFSEYNLIMGHFGYGLHQLFSKNTVYITMLRDPLERTVSNFEHFFRYNSPIVVNKFVKSLGLSKIQLESNGSSMLDESQKVNLLSLNLNDSFNKFIYKDIQTYHLGIDLNVSSLLKSIKAKDIRYNTIRMALTLPYMLSNYVEDKTVIKTAKERLNKFAFFGLSEKFKESVLLLYYTFGWKPKKSFLKINDAPSRLATKDLPKNVIDEISNLTKLDSELYSYAKEIFDIRFMEMVKDLENHYYEQKFADMPILDRVFEMLIKRYYERIGNLPRKESINYDFEQALPNGSGWHFRDVEASGKAYRWSGPENISEIEFPLYSTNDLKLRVHIAQYFVPAMLDSLKIKVNDILISTKTIHRGYNAITYEGIIPKSVFNGKNFLQVRFEVNKTASPHSVSKSSTDTRLLGLKFGQITISSLKD